jgi:hypothetical protein
MSFSTKKGPDGVTLVTIETPEGDSYTFRKISTKSLDPKLKREGHAKAKSMREGLRKAVQKARKQKVALQRVVPVS